MDIQKIVADMQAEDRARQKRLEVYSEISGERQRQDLKWGRQHWPHGDPSELSFWAQVSKKVRDTTDNHGKNGRLTWTDILYEEMTEAFAEGEWPKRRAELIQTAAVIVAEIEDGDIYHEPLTQVSINPGASEQNAAS